MPPFDQQGPLLTAQLRSPRQHRFQMQTGFDPWHHLHWQSDSRSTFPWMLPPWAPAMGHGSHWAFAAESLCFRFPSCVPKSCHCSSALSPRRSLPTTYLKPPFSPGTVRPSWLWLLQKYFTRQLPTDPASLWPFFNPAKGHPFRWHTAPLYDNYISQIPALRRHHSWLLLARRVEH